MLCTYRVFLFNQIPSIYQQAETSYYVPFLLPAYHTVRLRSPTCLSPSLPTPLTQALPELRAGSRSEEVQMHLGRLQRRRPVGQSEPLHRALRVHSAVRARVRRHAPALSPVPGRSRALQGRFPRQTEAV